MAKTVIQGAKLYIEGYDLSGDHNAIALQPAADAKDVTTIGDTSRKRIGGLRSFAASHAGYWEGGTDKVDDVLFARLGGSAVVSTICPTTGAEGEPAYFGAMQEVQYAPGGQVGEVFAFTVGLTSGTSDIYRGVILTTGSKSGSGTGTIMNLGVCPDTQKIRIAVHLLSITGGGTLTVTVKSSAVVGFTSPQTWFTSNAMSAIGAQLFSVLGPNNNAYWRAEWTLTGTAPTASFLVSFGIQ